MSTRGAHLWVPDSKDEAEALREKFGIGKFTIFVKKNIYFAVVD